MVANVKLAEKEKLPTNDEESEESSGSESKEIHPTSPVAKDPTASQDNMDVVNLLCLRDAQLVGRIIKKAPLYLALLKLVTMLNSSKMWLTYVVLVGT